MDQLLMLGDQIYADDLNFLLPDQTLDEYNSRYRDAFSQPYVRQLMSQVPTYMTLDDHEIEDNWPIKASERDWVTKYPAAIHAYMTYQVSHSPLFTVRLDQRISGVPDKLWYSFTDGCCAFFVADTRTERHQSDDEDEKCILSQFQLDALKNWLGDRSGCIKFIVSAVPMFPDSTRSTQDKWSGYLGQRDDILDFIRENSVERVVFLSGDVHCSTSAELTSPQDPHFKVISVISSAFFWPYPHPRRSDFRLSGDLDTLGSTIYRIGKAGPVHGTDNFTRISADLNNLEVEVFSRKGEVLGRKVHGF